MKPDICIYHGGCDDGFGAAWAVWKRWPDVQFIPGVYGKEPPDVKGKNVLMVDFSYKRPVIEAMAKAAYSLTILDHHKTAQADLQDLEAWAAMEGIGASVKVIFDMEQSGATITWQYITGTNRQDDPCPKTCGASHSVTRHGSSLPPCASIQWNSKHGIGLQPTQKS